MPSGGQSMEFGTGERTGSVAYDQIVAGTGFVGVSRAVVNPLPEGGGSGQIRELTTEDLLQVDTFGGGGQVREYIVDDLQRGETL